jgi:hypothetical protein
MRYFTSSSGALASVDISDRVYRYASRGWVLDDGLPARTVVRDWRRIGPGMIRPVR